MVRHVVYVCDYTLAPAVTDWRIYVLGSSLLCLDLVYVDDKIVIEVFQLRQLLYDVEFFQRNRYLIEDASMGARRIRAIGFYFRLDAQFKPLCLAAGLPRRAVRYEL